MTTDLQAEPTTEELHSDTIEQLITGTKNGGTTWHVDQGMDLTANTLVAHIDLTKFPKNLQLRVASCTEPEVSTIIDGRDNPNLDALRDLALHQIRGRITLQHAVIVHLGELAPTSGPYEDCMLQVAQALAKATESGTISWHTRGHNPFHELRLPQCAFRLLIRGEQRDIILAALHEQGMLGEIRSAAPEASAVLEALAQAAAATAEHEVPDLRPTPDPDTGTPVERLLKAVINGC